MWVHNPLTDKCHYFFRYQALKNLKLKQVSKENENGHISEKEPVFDGSDEIGNIEGKEASSVEQVLFVHLN